MTKTITIDGKEYVIAPLTLGQVEALLAEQESKGFQSGARTVLNGLRNAAIELKQEPLGPEAVAETPFPHFQQLHAAVLEFSGLKSVPKAGEAAAPVSALVN